MNTEKEIWKPGTLLYPLPAAMVSCGTQESGYNIITISWTATICSEPAMLSISVRPIRHSYEILKKTKEFVINLATEKLAYAADFCGVKSGRDMDKFKELNLTPVKASQVEAPLIKESPLNIECQVVDIKKLGSHDMFISKVVAINADKRFIDEAGAFRMDKAGIIAYCHGRYYCLGKQIGRFGFSVMKEKKLPN
ncbi:MAG: flavin reductase family protein [Candidatus Margulisiibacteriota bacterium]